MRQQQKPPTTTDMDFDNLSRASFMSTSMPDLLINAQTKTKSNSPKIQYARNNSISENAPRNFFDHRSNSLAPKLQSTARGSIPYRARRPAISGGVNVENKRKPSFSANNTTTTLYSGDRSSRISAWNKRRSVFSQDMAPDSDLLAALANPWLIQAESKFRISWDMLIFTLVIYLAISVPLDIALDTEPIDIVEFFFVYVFEVLKVEN